MQKKKTETDCQHTCNLSQGDWEEERGVYLKSLSLRFQIPFISLVLLLSLKLL